ncbi:MAG: hypothetical protein K2H36_05795 [Clostridia bacterium]|nr:hypothetical protein [Clostridia bacterium]
MKSVKVKVTILLVLVLVFIVLGGVCFAFPNGFSSLKAGVKVVEDFQVVNKNGDHSFTGIIKNTGNKTVEIVELALFCEPTNQNTGTVKVVVNKNTIVLQPDESYDLSSEGVQFHTNKSALYEIDKATAKTSAGVLATVYQSELSSEIVLIILLCFLVALILAMCAMFQQGLEWRSKNRIEMAQKALKENPNAIFLLGALCEKESRGSIKSILSVFGGIFRALLFGVRIYTKFSNATVMDMFLTDDGLYCGAGDERKIDISNMDFISRYDFELVKISGDRTNVVLDLCNGNYIAFDIKASGISKESLMSILDRVFNGREKAQDESNSCEKVGEEPFN